MLKDRTPYDGFSSIQSTKIFIADEKLLNISALSRAIYHFLKISIVG